MHKNMMVLIGGICLFLISCVSGLALAAQETLVLETYYPSPYGVYNELRLYPRTDNPGTPCTPGVMYYDDTADTLKVCAGFSPDWQPVGGGYWAASGSNIYNTNTGNVGIGTTGPSALLSLGNSVANSKLLIYDNGGSDTYGLGISAALLRIHSAGATSDIGFFAGASGGELLRIKGNGNVGIGTTGPGAKLDVGVGASQCCASQTPNASLAQASNTNGQMAWLQFHNAGEAEAYIRLAGGGAGLRSGQRRLEIGDSQSVTTGLTVTGNVGIGTTNPNIINSITHRGRALHIMNPNDRASLILDGNLGSGGALSLFNDRGAALNSRLWGIGTNTDGTISGSFQITAWNDDLTIKSRPFAIGSNGNVGIGAIIPPAYKLDVVSSTGGAGSVPLRLKSTAPETGTMLFQIGAQANTENTIVSLDLSETASKNFTIAGWNLANVGMIKLLANTTYVPGNVGIGTWSPGAYKLYVAGTIYTSGGCSGCSDVRWKKNISPLSNAVETVSKLKGVTFEWKVEEYPDMFFKKGKDIGLVAQEVEAVLPELVYEDKGYKLLRYERLAPLLVEAIKEQQREIDALRQEVGKSNRTHK